MTESTTFYVVVGEYLDGDFESECLGVFLNIAEAEKVEKDMDVFICEYKVNVSNICHIEVLKWESYDGPVVVECFTRDGKRVEATAQL